MGGGGGRIYHALTAAHPEFLQCCVLSGHYRYAGRFANANPVGSVVMMQSPPIPAAAKAGGGTGLTSYGSSGKATIGGSTSGGGGRRVILPGATAESFLRYHHLLGLIQIGCEDFARALSAFDVCLTTPARGAISAIQVAARKKSLVCRCLLDARGEGGKGEFRSSGVPAEGTTTSGLGGAFGGVHGAQSKRGAGYSRRVHRLLQLPAAVSPAVSRYIGSASSLFSSSKGGGGGGGNWQSGMDGGEPESEAPPPVVSAPPFEGLAASSPSWSLRRGGRREHERNYYQLGQYDHLVLAFCVGDTNRLKATVKSMSEILEMDGNLGLANCLKLEMRRAAVRRAAQVYGATSLEKAAEEVGLDGRREDAEVLISGMVAGDLASLGTTVMGVPFEARIDQEMRTVRFGPYDDELEDQEDDFLDRDLLMERMGACATLAERIRDLDVNIATSNRYQQIAMKGEAQSAAVAARAGSKGDSGPKSVADLVGLRDLP